MIELETSMNLFIVFIILDFKVDNERLISKSAIAQSWVVFIILGDPEAASRDERIFVGESLLQQGDEPGHFVLPNWFQKHLNFPLLIGQKNIFLANQRRGPAGAFLHEFVFLIDLRWPVSAIVKIKIKVCLAYEKRCCPKFFIQHLKMLFGDIHYGSKIITTDPTFYLWKQRFNSGSRVLDIGSNVFTPDPKF